MTFPVPRSRGDDAGSLAMAMLIIMIGVSLAALMAPAALVQIRSTRSQVQRSHALYAAEAGLDVLLAQVRAADDGSGNGVRASLPCGPLTGDVGGGSADQYQVFLFYVDFDPQTQMTSTPAWFAANDINCTAGSGPATLPSYVVAFSAGISTGATRTVRGAYRLRTSNANTAGGRIHIVYTAASTADLCMDTGATVTPAAGTTLRMQTCDTTRKQQIFAYNQNSTFQLVNSVTTAEPNGMCLDAGSPQTEGALVRFQPCVSPATAGQQWQYNSNAQFEGMDNAGNTNGFVFQLINPNAPGTTVEITRSPTWAGVYNNINSFAPEIQVGPGNAGPQHQQLVNFNQFGRCLDLTGGNYQIGFMIAWPCKPGWNQSYSLPPLATSPTSAAAGKITFNVLAGEPTPPGLYCLESPRSTAAWQYPAMVLCAMADPSPALQWRAYGYTGNYATSYRILDVDGNCLQPTDPNVPSPDAFDVGAQQISKIVIQPCNGSTLQKWNADPNIVGGLNLKYIGEN